MKIAKLSRLLSQYGELVSALNLSLGQPDDKTDKLLEVLVIRNQIHEVIREAPSAAFRASRVLTELDKQLTSLSETHALKVNRSLVTDSRKTLYGKDCEWWWEMFEGEVSNKLATFVLTALSVVCLSASVFLATDITQRIFSGGADGVSIAGILAQGALTALSASSLTSSGRAWFYQVFAQCRLPKTSFQFVSAAMAVSVVLVMTFGRDLLPSLAEKYIQQSREALQQGKLANADFCLKRAMSLAPDLAVPHYMQALVLYEMRQYEECKKECRITLRMDSKMPQPYILLARAIIADDDKYPEPLSLLTRAETLLAKQKIRVDSSRLTNNERELLYVLYTTRGRANLKLGLVERAQQDVDAARTLNATGEHGGGSFCLQATIQDAQMERSDDAWNACSTYLTPDEDFDPKWLNRGK